MFSRCCSIFQKAWDFLEAGGMRECIWVQAALALNCQSRGAPMTGSVDVVALAPPASDLPKHPAPATYNTPRAMLRTDTTPRLHCYIFAQHRDLVPSPPKVVLWWTAAKIGCTWIIARLSETFGRPNGC